MRSRSVALVVFLSCFACDPKLDIGPKTSPSVPSDGGGTPAKPVADGGLTEEDGGDAGDTPPPEEDAGITHVMDGVNDFAPSEKFVTTSTDYDAYFAWDAKWLYFGMNGDDVAANNEKRWVLIYLGIAGGAGTTTGVNYGGTQQPTLPFSATHHIRWKTSNTFTQLQTYDGGAWKDSITPVIVNQQGKFVEMAVSRSAIGATGKVDVHMNMLIEGGGDWTYAGMPSTSFTDGLNPTPFAHYFEFDLDAAKAPNAYSPK